VALLVRLTQSRIRSFLHQANAATGQASFANDSVIDDLLIWREADICPALPHQNSHADVAAAAGDLIRQLSSTPDIFDHTGSSCIDCCRQLQFLLVVCLFAQDRTLRLFVIAVVPLTALSSRRSCKSNSTEDEKCLLHSVNFLP
jgi:hypothetical protein